MFIKQKINKHIDTWILLYTCPSYMHWPRSAENGIIVGQVGEIFVEFSQTCEVVGFYRRTVPDAIWSTTSCPPVPRVMLKWCWGCGCCCCWRREYRTDVTWLRRVRQLSAGRRQQQTIDQQARRRQHAYNGSSVVHCRLQNQSVHETKQNNRLLIITQRPEMTFGVTADQQSSDTNSTRTEKVAPVVYCSNFDWLLCFLLYSFGSYTDMITCKKIY